MRENRVHPHHAEYAGAHDHHDRRHNSLSDSTGGGDGAVHERGDGVTPAHYAESLHACLDYRRIIREQGEESATENYQQSAQDSACGEGVGQAHEVAFHHSGVVPGTAVAADEACTGGVYCSLDVEYDCVRVGRGGVAGYRYRVEMVDSGLYKEVRHGENRILYSCRDSQHEYVGACTAADVFSGGAECAAVLPAAEVDHYKRRGKVLRDNTGYRNAVRRHSAADDEEKVQRNVQCSGDGQIHQRTPGFAAGAEYSAAEVVHRHRRHSQGIYPQICDRAGQQFGFRLQEVQHRLRQEKADKARQHADDTAHQQGGVHRQPYAVVVPGAQAVSRPDVNSGAHSNKKTGEQRNQQRCGANRPQRYVVREFPGYCDIAEVEEHLKHLRQHKRQAEH